MPATKKSSKPKDHISRLIEDILEKKMQSVGVELKSMVMKTSEEYFAKAMQSVLKDSAHKMPVGGNSTGDLVQNMGLSDGQMFNSVIHGLGRYLNKL